MKAAIVLILFSASCLLDAPIAAKADDIQDCVAPGKKGQAETKQNYLAGPELVSSTYFLPAGASVDLALRSNFQPKVRYFARIESRFGNEDDGESFVTVDKGALIAKQIPDDHALVKKGLVDKTDTLLTIQVPSSIGYFWGTAKVYVYTCDGIEKSPSEVSSLSLPLSPSILSTVITMVGVFVIYVFAAMTAKAVDPARDAYPTEPSWMRYLDPVFMTAGADGKGSLSKLQILFFSIIVFGLLAYIVMRTGVLSDLSATILALLGIAAVGSATAKATDVQRDRLDFENWSWFIKKGWLPPQGLAAVNIAKWRDIVTSDGEFDVYRYQNCIFSLVVGAALLSTGVSELSTFSVPQTLLGILGLSQVVYVAGKLVSPPSFADLNASTKAVRALEKDFSDTANTTPDPAPAAGQDPAALPQDLESAKRRAGIAKYKAYIEAAESLRIGFEALVGRQVSDQAIQPSFRI